MQFHLFNFAQGVQGSFFCLLFEILFLPKNLFFYDITKKLFIKSFSLFGFTVSFVKLDDHTKARKV